MTEQPAEYDLGPLPESMVLEAFSRSVVTACPHEVAAVVVADILNHAETNFDHGPAVATHLIRTQAHRAAAIVDGSHVVRQLGARLFVVIGAPNLRAARSEAAAMERALRAHLGSDVIFDGLSVRAGVTTFVETFVKGDSASAALDRLDDVREFSAARDYRLVAHLLADLQTLPALVEGLADLAPAAGLTAVDVLTTDGCHQAEFGDRPTEEPDGVLQAQGSPGVNIRWWAETGHARDDFVYSAQAMTAAIEAALARIAARESALGEADLDPLTGLLNRRGLMRRLAGLDGSAAVVVVDVDYLKRINDGAGGHLAGDRAICRVAGLLLEGRGDDVVARWGGEEFVAVLPGTSPAGAAAWLRRLLNTAQEPGDGVPAVSFSAGVAECVLPSGFEEAFAAADKAMYEAKNAGRSNIVEHH